ncbi:unnamed protein product [Coregonus sp. 'balchen']|nr:unnamed protein product [Coregonus sp. 'balchen']
MNTIVFNKLSNQVLFDEKTKEVERSSINYLEVIDGQHPDLHPDLLSSNHQVIKDNNGIRHRRSTVCDLDNYVMKTKSEKGRQSSGKVRHKRQALQDMARPLKQWLYKHRDNPYPTKTEKILLALGSQMTLVQRLSVSSDDTCSEDGDNTQRTQTSGGEFSKPMYQSVIKKEGAAMMGVGLRAAASLAEDYVTPPPKYKSSLLHRYLNDSLRHVMVANAVMDARKRNHSGSFSSNEYDDDLLSPSSSETEANFVYRAAPSGPFVVRRAFLGAVTMFHCCSTPVVLFQQPGSGSLYSLFSHSPFISDE